MYITYAQHARDRMRERAIKEQHVRQCLAEPDVHYQGGKGSNIYRARVEGRMLKVMVARDRDTSQAKHVVTAAWEDDDGN
ncbi:MAG: DUF4258 domain-containing protein [Pseudonocardiaceae bacterium]